MSELVICCPHRGQVWYRNGNDFEKYGGKKLERGQSCCKRRNMKKSE